MANRLTATRKAPRATALYLYGITRASARPPRIAVPGIDGDGGVEAVPCSGLLCWLSRVDRRQFADELPQHMENLEWLADASVRHQRVVAEIAAWGDILPARFGTVFLSEESLSQDVKRRKRLLQAALRRIANADEWGVKVFAPQPAASAVKARSGREYLEKKADLLRDRKRRPPSAEVLHMARTLRRIAKASTEGGKVSGGQRHLEWQASFLVPRARRRQWDAALKKFAARWRDGHRIECTGPWPPYSFAAPEKNA
jgi:hypothetical protein